MKKSVKKFSITWITVWLLLTAVAFSVFIGYATYTGITSLKRVASTRAGAGILFSSNYMKHGTTPQGSIEYRDYSEFLDADGVPTDENPVYNMVICNYAQGDMATWYTANDIGYTVQAELFLNQRYTSEDQVNEALIGTYKSPTAADIGEKKFGIRFADGAYTYFSDEQLTVTLPAAGSYSLSKNEASTDTFSLLFDKSELLSNAPGFWIKVTATPNTISGGEVEVISGYVGTCKSASGGANWTGYIEDEDYEQTDYDSYNYIISGNGKGTFYFAWNDDKVNPNEFALQNYAADIAVTPAAVTSWTTYTQYGSTVPAGTNWKYIKLNVDSEHTARYEIQLYKTGGQDYRDVISKYTDYYFEAEQAVIP